MEDAVNNHSLFPLETCPHVPDEAFRLFHTIDRELYAALTRRLRRDPAESVQVAAFLMWLERECGDSTLVKRVSSLPPLLISAVADEAALCVRCVESDAFPVGEEGSGEVKLLSELLHFPAGVSLRFLHDNRTAVLRGVAKIINTVCWRAFADLFHPGDGATADGGCCEAGTAAAPPLHAMQQLMYNPYLDHVPVGPLPGAIRMPHPPPSHRPPLVADVIGLPLHVLAAGGFPAYDVAAQRQMVSHELGDLMRMNLNLANTNTRENVERDREREVSPDDRTIFLTFSKGYPTTEEEVREYFTRKFGDFIEDLIMQEVEGDDQPLYAKMVARSAAVIDGIVEGNKAKYSINGKHVWARKYVKKPPLPQQQRSPPRGEASGSSPSAAMAKKA